MVKAATYNIYSKLLGECSVKTRLPSHGRSLRERERELVVCTNRNRRHSQKQREKGSVCMMKISSPNAVCFFVCFWGFSFLYIYIY